MAYIKKKIAKLDAQAMPAYKVLMNALNLSISQAQKLIDKKRLFCNDKLVNSKNEPLLGLIELIDYENAPRGLKVLFENAEFAVVIKPSGVLTHPNGRHCEYSLCDEIWHLWGRAACVAHRLDKGTSGLVLIAKSKASQVFFKSAFEKRRVHKEYLALVRGKTATKFSVDLPLNLARDYDALKTRMCVDEKSGKPAISHFETLFYDESLNASFIKCVPQTGRQHQLRVHLHALGHSILGDTLYGLDKAQIERILDEDLSVDELKALTGASRLCLHASCLKFNFAGKEFEFKDETGIYEKFVSSLE